MDFEDTEIDARVRDAVLNDPADASTIQRAVRKRIAVERRLQIGGVAFAVIVAGLVGYRALRPERLYADAALDHRLEVMEHQPRHWRTDPAEIAKLAARYELSDLVALAPAGYRLEHAKMCGIDGTPALHLVYSNGSNEISVFMRQRRLGDGVLRDVKVGREHLSAFGHGRLEVVVATAGSSGDCLEFAKALDRGL